MRTVSIGESLFLMAFGRDVDFHDLEPQTTWLDLETGDVIWVFDEDSDAYMAAGIDPKENRSLREQIEDTPEKYLLIPGLSHGEHHDILREFLNSNWTVDKELRRRTRDAYTSSIGGWMERIDDRQIVHAFYEFRDTKIMELAEEFLASFDIKPLWRI